MKNTVMRCALLFASVLILASCASMSAPKNPDRSYLVIMSERSSTDKNDFFCYYKLEGDVKKIRVNPNQKFTKVNNFPADTYLSKYVGVYYMKTDNLFTKYPYNVTYELKPSTVTILSHKLVVSLKDTTGRGKSQYWDIKPLTDEDYQSCVDYIRQQKEYEGLAISEQMKF